MIVRPKAKSQTSLFDTPNISLSLHADYLKSLCLQELFTYHPNRNQEMHITCGALTLDFSHQRITPDTLYLFEELAQTQDLLKKINSLFTGELVNSVEQRPALHTALRDPSKTAVFVNNINIKPSIEASFEKMFQLCQHIWQNDIKDILVLGIGGSYWGSRCVYEALQILPKKLNIHFLGDIEQEAFDAIIASLSPQKTVVLVISKSFTTQEVLCNAHRARVWLGAYFNDHCLAISANLQQAKHFGIKPAHILEFGTWVGGRYSVWSTVGMPIALAYGIEVFQALHQGAHQMDQHVIHAPIFQNLPMMAALLTFFNTRLLDISTEAIIPYSFRMNSFIPYIQQLGMESLGKCHDIHGNPIMGATGPIIWGQTGLHAQHSFNQLLHQGKHAVAIDFILPMDKKEQVSHCYAQSRALAFGDLEHPLVHARTPGNQPHNILKIATLSPETLGLLMAFYEHKTYLLACLYNINAFDQFGVELAKRLSLENITV